MADPCLKKLIVVLETAAVCLAAGCSSAPEPHELSPMEASALISQKWAHDELNHFTVTFHSDTVMECGIQNGLWKRVEREHQGFTFSTYQLTETGRNALFAIDLKDSGKFHEVILRGPYRLDLTSMTLGREPDTRQVGLRWEIDWDKAPAGLKACLPRFELSGSQIALFKLDGVEWRFLSFLKPADAAPPPQASTRLPNRAS